MAHATQWYADAMRLWKRGPLAFSLIALVILAANILLNFVPIAGTAIAQLVLPLLECGLLYAALAADRGDQPRARHLIAFVAAPFRAQVAVVVAGLLVFAAEALVAQLVDGTNLLAPGSNVEAVSGVGIVSAYAAGIAVPSPSRSCLLWRCLTAPAFALPSRRVLLPSSSTSDPLHYSGH